MASSRMKTRRPRTLLRIWIPGKKPCPAELIPSHQGRPPQSLRLCKFWRCSPGMCGFRSSAVPVVDRHLQAVKGRFDSPPPLPEISVQLALSQTKRLEKMSCSGLRLLGDFDGYITKIRVETNFNDTRLLECQHEICSAIFGDGNADISGIGVCLVPCNSIRHVLTRRNPRSPSAIAPR